MRGSSAGLLDWPPRGQTKVTKMATKMANLTTLIIGCLNMFRCSTAQQRVSYRSSGSQVTEKMFNLSSSMKINPL